MFRAMLSLAACLGLLTTAARAQDGCPAACSPQRICCPVPEVTKEAIRCFEVEAETICIPAVRFPWEKCCPPRCGKVRTVHVLKQLEFETERCGYRWEVQPLPCAIPPQPIPPACPVTRLPAVQYPRSR